MGQLDSRAIIVHPLHYASQQQKEAHFAAARRRRSRRTRSGVRSQDLPPEAWQVVAEHVQSGVELGYGVVVAVAIAVVANVAPAAAVACLLAVDRHRSSLLEWAAGVAEFLVACALLFLFGSGLYVGPLFMGLAGLCRLFVALR